MTSEKAELDLTTDVAIVGAGPVGLMTANLLGRYGVRALVLDERETLIDYPRGVAMDDECLRAFQAAGLAEAVLPHTTPDQWMRFYTTSGKCFASIEPRTREYGWPRRNGFVQPLADKVLLDGTERFEDVTLLFGHTVEGFEQDEDGVRVRAKSGGRNVTVNAKLLVGCDGGRSTVRKELGISFDGRTDATHWLVVDIADDPIGLPNAVLHCNPARPFVSICLPHGIRRLEFMVMKGETEEEIVQPDRLHALLREAIDEPAKANIIRNRVYTHHARLAAGFVEGRVLIAGDAAHLMPVWQGQGYNSGIRDAMNLAWKAAAVLKGHAGLDLLKTYDIERRPHARAMIDISVLAGRIFSPTSRFLAGLRNVALLALKAVPPFRRYVLQMRFKPMPRYEDGAVVRDPRAGKNSAVGRMFIQPTVALADGSLCRLDDALGPWFAMLSWGQDPARHMDDEARALWRGLGGRTVVARPMPQTGNVGDDAEGTLSIGDPDGLIKDWIDAQPGTIVFLRPDRFVAAVCQPQHVSETVRALAGALHLAAKD